MPISAYDSLLFKNIFGTERIRDIFDDKAYTRRCVDVEAALAVAESKCGVIPSATGEKIASTLRDVDLDFERLSSETEIVGYPILPLVRQLSEACDDDVGGYVVSLANRDIRLILLEKMG